MQPPIAFLDALVIDGLGADPIRYGIVIIEGDRITAVGSVNSVPMPPDAIRVDLAGMTLMPGLIDCHVHITSQADFDPMSPLKEINTYAAIRSSVFARDMLLAGITSFRDAGSVGMVSIGLQQAIDAGIVPGPRVVPCGQYISMTGRDSWGRFRPEIENRMEVQVTGVDQVRLAAREQLRRGAKAIKLMATGLVGSDAGEATDEQLTEEEMRAGVQEAHKHGRHAFSHAHGPGGCRNAVAAGVDSLEHGSFLTEEVVDMMVRQGTYLVPTMSLSRKVETLGAAGGYPEYYVRKGAQVRPHRQASFRLAREKGVKVAMGTDSGGPGVRHADSAYELECMVHAGMSTMEAIVASTSNAADLIRLRDTGSLQPGKLADLIVVDGNPLDDIRVLQETYRIRVVMKGGDLYRDHLKTKIGLSSLMRQG